ncbi:hypothetical protein HAX54_053209, partial [Datura stramonium]|nr:hypothetical protein [Datura stramonium]
RIHADVWVWKEYGVKESWTKMFTINLPYDPVGYQCCPFFACQIKVEFCFSLDQLHDLQSKGSLDQIFRDYLL